MFFYKLFKRASGAELHFEEKKIPNSNFKIGIWNF